MSRSSASPTVMPWRACVHGQLYAVRRHRPPFSRPGGVAAAAEIEAGRARGLMMPNVRSTRSISRRCCARGTLVDSGAEAINLLENFQVWDEFTVSVQQHVVYLRRDRRTWVQAAAVLVMAAARCPAANVPANSNMCSLWTLTVSVQPTHSSNATRQPDQCAAAASLWARSVCLSQGRARAAVGSGNLNPRIVDRVGGH